MNDPLKTIEETVRSRAARLEDITGTAGLAAIFEILHDLEVGVMREAFQLQPGATRWEYYAGMREGIITIASALRATVGEGKDLREQEGQEDEALGAEDLGITFGGGDLS